MLLLVITSLLTGAFARCRGVTLGQHANGGGKRCTLGVGRHGINVFRGRCPGNDHLSHVRVRGNCVVYLYQHHKFQGKRWILSGQNKGWNFGKCFHNDAVSSLIVVDGGCQGAILSQHSHTNRGAHCKLKAGNYRWIQGVRGCPRNDHLSKVRNIGNCKTTVYKHANFKGQSWRLSGSRTFTGRRHFANDHASSVRVQDIGCRGVVLSQHGYKRGRWCYLRAGNYPWIASRALRRKRCPPNDSISHVKTFGNCKVYLYQHSRYKGRRHVMQGMNRGFRYGKFFKNDDISSLKIRSFKTPRSTTCSRRRAEVPEVPVKQE